MRDQSDAGPAVRLVDSMLAQAIEQNATDIHIEPLADRLRIRLRVNGDLVTLREESVHLAAPVASRIKILADLDVANRRAPQDGRTSIAAGGRPIDIRISTIPSAHGETVALRLLRRDPALLNLTALGFSAPIQAILDHVISVRRGLFLITGPTGSGKTTTLYALIERLRHSALKILSVEDPIEYFFPDVTQTQVNEDAGVTFSSALRAFLRQDPDVILVGEIRDPETARIAVQAALTGHLVLATLHTIDAPSAIARLVDMGVDRYLVAATTIGVASQRLLRRLCPSCRLARTMPGGADFASPNAQAQAAHVFECNASGCAACNGRGYAGRIAVAEGYLATEAVQTAMYAAGGAGLQAALGATGFQPLFDTARALAHEGVISWAEASSLASA